MRLKGSSYMVKVGNSCTSTIRGLAVLNDKNYWLMGTNIYRTYEIVHDGNEKQMGFKQIASSEIIESLSDQNSATLTQISFSAMLVMVSMLAFS